MPGLLDLDELRNLCARSTLPVNAMAVPSGPTITEFATAGVRRISLGTALAQSAYTAARRTAAELMTDGGITSLEGALDFAELNSLFRG